MSLLLLFHGAAEVAPRPGHVRELRLGDLERLLEDTELLEREIEEFILLMTALDD